MTAEIYYFSGTGNSFVAARDLSRKINARLTPVASLIHKDPIDSDADTIGFVFPIYDFKPPELIVKFANRIENLDSKYVFAACTYGIAPLKALEFFSRSIQSNGGNLSSGFAVKMPHN
ncbi:MAG: EFR1 family ferrodoxin, partial [Candidatus Geothermincolia bacterium]